MRVPPASAWLLVCSCVLTACAAPREPAPPPPAAPPATTAEHAPAAPAPASADADRAAPAQAPAALAPTSATAAAEPTRAGRTPDAPELVRALESIRPENIRADVFFIASDELRGRDTPSPGQRLAARYLRARLERLGFTPGGDDGFFDRYALERASLDEEASRAWIARGGEERALVLGSDYSFRGGADHELLGEVVFVGSGSEAELAGRDLSGKWALALDPAGGGRDRAAFAERMARVERARAAGAIGLVTATDPAAAGEARPLSRPSPGRLRPAGDGAGSGDLPTLSLSPALVGELFGAARPAVGDTLPLSLGETRRYAREAVDLENVAGLWPGSDDTLKKEVLIVSAHYDHVGVQNGEIYNGADDNGSGTCGMLALAEALAKHGPLRRSVLLLWVSGEEKGLLGSDAWTRAPTLPEGWRAVCDLNIDMIGRNAPDQLLITPTHAHPAYNGLTRLAEGLGPSEGFPVLGSADEYWTRSDHANFSEHLGIPVAFLFSDVHEDYHQPGDDPEKIDCDKIRRVTRLVLRMLAALQGDALAL